MKMWPRNGGTGFRRSICDAPWLLLSAAEEEDEEEEEKAREEDKGWDEKGEDEDDDEEEVGLEAGGGRASGMRPASTLSSVDFPAPFAIVCACVCVFRVRVQEGMPARTRSTGNEKGSNNDTERKRAGRQSMQYVRCLFQVATNSATHVLATSRVSCVPDAPRIATRCPGSSTPDTDFKMWRCLVPAPRKHGGRQLEPCSCASPSVFASPSALPLLLLPVLLLLLLLLASLTTEVKAAAAAERGDGGGEEVDEENAEEEEECSTCRCCCVGWGAPCLPAVEL